MVHEQLVHLAMENYRHAMEIAKEGYHANTRYLLGDAIEFAAQAGDDELLEILQAEDCALEHKAQNAARERMNAIDVKLKELDAKIKDVYSFVKDSALIIAGVSHPQMNFALAGQVTDVIAGIAGIKIDYKKQIFPNSESTTRSSTASP